MTMPRLTNGRLCVFAIACLFLGQIYLVHRANDSGEDGTILPANGQDDSVMLAIEMLPYNGYAKFTASVLRDYLGVSSSDMLLFTSNPSVYDDNRESSWRAWYGEGVRIFQPSIAGTLSKEVLNAFLKSKYHVLLLLRSDMVLLKDWKKFVSTNIRNTDGILSIYRRAEDYKLGYLESEWLEFTCKNFHDGLCEGNMPGTHGIAMTKNIAKILLGKEKRYCSQSGLKKASEDHGFKLFYSPNSFAIHVGQTNQTQGGCGLNEAPHKFNKCDLPAWIQDGIEFYFDRCTDPNEIYSFSNYKTDPVIRERFWTRPALSFSLYGSSPRYTRLALLNANRMSSIYPGWKMWIYHDNTVPKEVLSDLCLFDVHFINMAGSEIENRMSWRFLVASEPVELFAIRDIDSWILKRGKDAVDEWISSGKKFHIMRDSPYHSPHPINGGLWGGRHDAVPNMKQLLLEKGVSNRKMEDMHFLKNVIWPLAKNSYLAHDSYPTGEWGDTRSFPTTLKLEDKRFFVGSVN